ncbi:hypothetical protein AAC387_Pa05g3216 [Persea americana]
MGDHFVLLVDRLLTESTLEAAIENRKVSQNGCASASASASAVEVGAEFSLQKSNFSDVSLLPRKLVECRICHDEDEDSNMETPCSCCGSLKYAHRKCVQRWCNEKGDIICEICRQQFKPGYTAPPQLLHYGGVPMNFRGNWEITRRDLHNSRFIAMVATDRDFDYDDYSSSSETSTNCCRAVALIFMVLLILRHTLPIIISGAEENSFALFLLLLLHTVGILLPVYIMARALIATQRRRQQQPPHEFSLRASEENVQLQSVPQPHFIHVH